MELDENIKNIVEELSSKYKLNDLKKCSFDISGKYLDNNSLHNRLVVSEKEVLTYAIVRMPATYSAVYDVLKYSFEIYKPQINSVLDIGCGVGTASIALSHYLDQKVAYTMLEREEEMISLGKKFTSNLNAIWKSVDYVENKILDKADLVIASYTLNEVQIGKRKEVLKSLYDAANEMLIIVEPGTPSNFLSIKEYREELVKLGGYIIAPCPQCEKCLIEDNDWCHFSTRVSRSKIHKFLKEGEAPFEDEKYTYIAISKKPFDKEMYHRILRHPNIRGNTVEVTTCSSNGINKFNITKSSKEHFKEIKKKHCGDKITI